MIVDNLHRTIHQAGFGEGGLVNAKILENKKT